MCYGVAILANNDKAVYGKGTSSHTTTCEQLKLNEDQWIKYEYHWWDKQLVIDHYDPVGEDIIAGIDRRIAEKHAKSLVKTHFRTQKQLIEWLKDNKDEWGRLLEHGSPAMIKAVCPALADYIKKIKSFKVSDKINPYQAEKIPDIKTLKKALPKKVRDQVWDQVGDQVWATSYWAIKMTFGLPIKHWFFDFLKLGVMVVFVQGKVKVFGKNGKYLGEYDEKDFN